MHIKTALILSLNSVFQKRDYKIGIDIFKKYDKITTLNGEKYYVRINND